MSYPNSLDNFTPRTDGVDDVMAQDINELQTAIEAIEAELGTDPAGSATDVKSRLGKSLSNAGYLQMDSPTSLTISSGAITVSRNFHIVDTEGGASSDDLDTINGYAAGHILVLRTASASRDVVVRHNTGNILCANGANITLDAPYNFVFGFYDGAQSKWILAKMF